MHSDLYSTPSMHTTYTALGALAAATTRSLEAAAETATTYYKRAAYLTPADVPAEIELLTGAIATLRAVQLQARSCTIWAAIPRAIACLDVETQLNMEASALEVKLKALTATRTEADEQLARYSTATVMQKSTI